MTGPEPPVGPHTPLRPLWLCRTDGQPWPCAAARLRLVREYPDSRGALCVRLGSSLAEAYRDLHALDPAGAPAVTALSERFLGWLSGS
ncbi:hypothetical protein O7626_23420 [Micromonospora sp. WMMD1102]|uniref:hypothetical protein n=1 Tax=Micromonospora sp. WMMD1102 TaxID=3016105 RepID=UPI002414F9AC|nr:hypothetical protein [Micromonospora sp. WMMD1102]MDG4788838.1 hypothetical protein [Micromonospora sp. WMMD1102]